MKNIVKILMVLSLTVFCFGAKAQISKGDKPFVGATHMYKKGDLNLASSKYLWMVLKDGAIADRGVDYVFVTSKAKDATIILGEVPVVTALGDIVNYAEAKENYNNVYIKWLKEGNYKVVGSEFDNNSHCFDENVNKTELVVTAIANAFVGSLVWNTKSDNTYLTTDYSSYDTNLFPCATLNFDNGTAGDKSDDKTRISFEVNADKYVGHYHFKYQYLVKYNNTLKTEQKLTTSGLNSVLDAPTDWTAASIEVEAFGNDALNIINIDTDIEQGDGRAFVWLKITYMVDDNNLEASNLTTLVRCAVLSQLPTPKLITFD